MKSCSAFPKAPASLAPHHLIVLWTIVWEMSYPSAKLQTVYSTAPADLVINSKGRGLTKIDPCSLTLRWSFKENCYTASMVGSMRLYSYEFFKSNQKKNADFYAQQLQSVLANLRKRFASVNRRNIWLLLLT